MFFLIIIVFIHTDYASSQTLTCQLTDGTSCPTMICPNTDVKYICNVSSYAGYTNWNVPSVGACNGAVLSLAQNPPARLLSCLTSSSSAVCGPFTVTNTPPLISNIYCLTSTLSVVVTPAMNDLLVSCSSYSSSSFTSTLVGSTPIYVLAPPSAPNISSSMTSISPDRRTVTWTSASTATSYNVSINGSTPVSLPADADTYTFTGLTNNTVYTVSVVAINCAGNSSAALTILQTAETASRNGSVTSIATAGTSLFPFPTMATVLCVSVLEADTFTPAASSSVGAADNSAIGTALGVSVSVTFVVSSLGVLVASVLCYISRRSKESHKPSSHADPVYDEVCTNKKLKGDVMEIVANAAYGPCTS